jgi:alkanesulfonate monooxygenase SsuD/methylene tetrahydromethanopterin reductase-like flavin-dependent oxidoreductase (luciferase family)
MKIGVKTGQGGYKFDELSSIWKKAESLGFDSAWLYDHFVALGNPDLDCLEAYSTLGALARETDRLRIGVMATCVPYRNPPYLAKIASTLDVISNGRFMLGLGAGWVESEFKAYGYQFRPDPERVQQLRETLAIVSSMWREEKPTFNGKHYSVEAARNFPKPLQRFPPIWVGITRGTKVLPRVDVSEADGFNTMSPAALCRDMIATAEKERQTRKKARNDVTYSIQAFVMTGSETEIQRIVDAEALRQGTSAKTYLESLRRRDWLIGSPDYCSERLREFTQAGIDYILFVVGGDRLGWPLEIVKDKLIPHI